MAGVGKRDGQDPGGATGLQMRLVGAAGAGPSPFQCPSPLPFLFARAGRVGKLSKATDRQTWITFRMFLIDMDHGQDVLNRHGSRSGCS